MRYVTPLEHFIDLKPQISEVWRPDESIALARKHTSETEVEEEAVVVADAAAARVAGKGATLSQCRGQYLYDAVCVHIANVILGQIVSPILNHPVDARDIFVHKEQE